MSEKIDYDFIEIGTSNFETIIEDCPEDSVGLCVEPMEEYLNQLPSRKKVTKVSCAVKGFGEDESKEIYFIPEEAIDRLGLPQWLKGCNSVGFLHDNHSEYASLVEKKQTNLISVKTLFEKYNVGKAESIKIDAESYDRQILLGLLDHFKNNPDFELPKWIQFEAPALIPPDYISLINSFGNIGYELEYVGFKNSFSCGNNYLFVLNEDD